LRQGDYAASIMDKILYRAVERKHLEDCYG
jgi:hypothetical protein